MGQVLLQSALPSTLIRIALGESCCAFWMCHERHVKDIGQSRLRPGSKHFESIVPSFEIFGLCVSGKLIE